MKAHFARPVRLRYAALAALVVGAAACHEGADPLGGPSQFDARANVVLELSRSTAAPGDTVDAEYAMSALTKRGVIFLGCAMATQGMAGILAKRSGDKADAMFDELRRHLIPGLTLQPSGIFAVMRAQESGCHYMRST